MPGGVFISYRREDARGFAGRIYDRLVSRLGREKVFFDIDSIQLECAALGLNRSGIPGSGRIWFNLLAGRRPAGDGKALFARLA
jgi:hypothetical protein